MSVASLSKFIDHMCDFWRTACTLSAHRWAHMTKKHTVWHTTDIRMISHHWGRTHLIPMTHCRTDLSRTWSTTKEIPKRSKRGSNEVSKDRGATCIDTCVLLSAFCKRTCIYKHLHMQVCQRYTQQPQHSQLLDMYVMCFFDGLLPKVNMQFTTETCVRDCGISGQKNRCGEDFMDTFTKVCASQTQRTAATLPKWLRSTAHARLKGNISYHVNHHASEKNRFKNVCNAGMLRKPERIRNLLATIACRLGDGNSRCARPPSTLQVKTSLHSNKT